MDLQRLTLANYCFSLGSRMIETKQGYVVVNPTGGLMFWTFRSTKDQVIALVGRNYPMRTPSGRVTRDWRERVRRGYSLCKAIQSIEYTVVPL